MSASPWISLAVSDLRDYLVAEQLDALRTEALGSGQADPFATISADVIAKVRAYIASNPLNQVDANKATIPPELKLDVCHLIIAPMLGRLGIALNDDQRKAIDLAQTTLVALREKKLVVSLPANAVVPSVQGGTGVQIVSAGSRLTRESLRGL